MAAMRALMLSILLMCVLLVWPLLCGRVLLTFVLRLERTDEAVACVALALVDDDSLVDVPCNVFSSADVRVVADLNRARMASMDERVDVLVVVDGAGADTDTGTASLVEAGGEESGAAAAGSVGVVCVAGMAVVASLARSCNIVRR